MSARGGRLRRRSLIKPPDRAQAFRLRSARASRSVARACGPRATAGAAAISPTARRHASYVAVGPVTNRTSSTASRVATPVANDRAAITADAALVENDRRACAKPSRSAVARVDRPQLCAQKAMSTAAPGAIGAARTSTRAPARYGPTGRSSTVAGGGAGVPNTVYVNASPSSSSEATTTQDAAVPQRGRPSRT